MKNDTPKGKILLWLAHTIFTEYVGFRVDCHLKVLSSYKLNMILTRYVLGSAFVVFFSQQDSVGPPPCFTAISPIDAFLEKHGNKKQQWWFAKQFDFQVS